MIPLSTPGSYKKTLFHTFNRICTSMSFHAKHFSYHSLNHTIYKHVQSNITKILNDMQNTPISTSDWLRILGLKNKTFVVDYRFEFKNIPAHRRKCLSSIHCFDISVIPCRIRIVKLNLGSHRTTQ